MYNETYVRKVTKTFTNCIQDGQQNLLTIIKNHLNSVAQAYIN